MIGRRRGGMSLGRVAKKVAVATVVNRVVNNAMDNRMGNNHHSGMQQPAEQPPQRAISQACPSCQSDNPQQAKFCLNCGNGLATTQPTQQQAVPLTHCPGCKANLMGMTGNFCPYCRSAIR